MLTGNGDGSLAAPVVMGIEIASNQGPYSLIATDFNRDGKLDLAVAVSTGADGLLSAGPQPSTPGLDQVTVQLPSTLAGSGCTILWVESESLASERLVSNTVYVCIK